ncbi:LrgB family protein [Rossellomorea aquimaris]|uniref:Putative effector of murein hydrolase n=1 Tax=Rossellomorea aquimaris TaxID=189382 RepID=A0A366EZY8_9BACI|nr:LrgB family protein [Rossellomorea aquimaris]RBP07963.1 putative effector of murein hydrolase [Rossellomorea aquimaris]
MIHLISSLMALGITVLYFIFGVKIHRLWPNPVTIPIFISTIALIVTLLIIDIPYEQYADFTSFITYLLGPATVALAYPLYQHRKLLVQHVQPILFGILSGSGMSMLISYFFSMWLGIPSEWSRSLLIKTITTPVAVDIGKVIEANIEVIPTVVIVTGMFGAMIIPSILKWLHVKHPIAKGLPFGVISHGVGTAQAIKEGEREGAVSGAAMALTATIMSFVIPILFLFV